MVSKVAASPLTTGGGKLEATTSITDEAVPRGTISAWEAGAGDTKFATPKSQMQKVAQVAPLELSTPTHRARQKSESDDHLTPRSSRYKSLKSRSNVFDSFVEEEERRTKSQPASMLLAEQSQLPPEISTILNKEIVANEELPLQQNGSGSHSKWVIDPRWPIMRKWDLVTFILLVFTAIVTPYEVAFLTTRLNVLFFVNRLVDLLFIIDLFFCFFLAYFDVHEGTWVTDLQIIRPRYLRTWFPIDVVSILPFDILGFTMGSEAVNSLKILRVVRLLRLAKLLRILRAGRIFRRIESFINIDYVALELLKFTVMIAMQSHWIACVFGVMDTMQGTDGTWLYAYFCDDDDESCDPRADLAASEKYLVALYWAVTTLTTIGYGDLNAINSTERLVLCFVMLIGAFQYGYIIGALGSILASSNERRNRWIAMLMELNAFMEEGRLPSIVRQKLREYFKYRSNTPDVKDYHNILTQLSPKLRGEVAMLLDNKWLQSVYLFQTSPLALVIQVALTIRQQTFPPHETVFEKGTVANNMYIIKKGLVSIGGQIFRRWHTLMLECLYKQTVHEESCYTVTFVDIWMVDRDRMRDILLSFPECETNFRVSSIRRVLKREILAYTRAHKIISSMAPEERKLTVEKRKVLHEADDCSFETADDIVARNTLTLLKKSRHDATDPRIQWYIQKIHTREAIKMLEHSTSVVQGIINIQRNFRMARERRMKEEEEMEETMSTESLIRQVNELAQTCHKIKANQDDVANQNKIALYRLRARIRDIHKSLGIVSPTKKGPSISTMSATPLEECVNICDLEQGSR